MAASEVAICNLALGRIGAGRISALNDQSAEARACNAIYAILRDELLERHPWTFAIGRSELSQDATAPEFDYSYRYALPADCLRVIKVNDEDVAIPVNVFGNDIDGTIYSAVSGQKWWEIEQGFLCTNETAISIKYIARITDPTKFSSSFVKLLTMRLAPDLAMQITKNATLAESLEAKFFKEFADATGVNSQQDHPDTTAVSSYVTARH
jgi:hypothetical protein